MTGTSVAGLCRQASPIAASLAMKSRGGRRPGAALIMEADLVGHRMVAEDDRQLVLRLVHLPRAVEQLGMADVAPAVAADLAVGRTSQDFFIGRDPVDSLPRPAAG